MKCPLDLVQRAAFALSAVFLLAFAFVVTQQTHNPPAIEEPKTTAPAQSSDEPIEAGDQGKDVAPQVWEPAAGKDEAPESTVKQLVQAWNYGDADKIAQLFLPDGVLRLPTGSEIKSREEIKNTFPHKYKVTGRTRIMRIATRH